MTDRDIIRAEIERRMKCFKNERNTITKASDNNLSLGARIAMCEEILSFIDSLQEEPSETGNVWFDVRNSVPEDSTNQIICIREDGLAVATVGKIVSGTTKWAYLGALLQVVNKETYKGLSENQCRNLIDTAFEFGKETINDKPVSKELENQSKKYSYSWYCSSLKELNGTGCGCISVQEAFMAGAEWQKKQMIKDVVEGFVCLQEKDMAIVKSNIFFPTDLKEGDKVKLIIIREGKTQE